MATVKTPSSGVGGITLFQPRTSRFSPLPCSERYRLTLSQKCPTLHRCVVTEQRFSQAKCSAASFTEVPLVFEMATPIWSPIYTGLVELVATLSSSFISVRILQFATKRANEESWSTELAPDSRVKRSRTVVGAVLRAVTSPLTFILPAAAVLRCSVADLGGVLEFILRILSPLDDAIGVILKQSFLFGSVWFLVTFKNQLVPWLLEQRAKRDPVLLQDIRRIVLPLNTLATWAIVTLGAITAACLLGVDIRPLLTFAGVCGVVIGLGAQSVLVNMVAGINLFLARPFVAGDRVEVFNNNGSLIFCGMVERVNPLRTIIRTDKNYPLTIPNKLLSEMVIGNESRFLTKTTTAYESGRRVGITLKFSLEHFDKLKQASERIHALLESFAGLNHGMPFGVTVGTLTDTELTLDIYATALKRESAKFGELRVRLMKKLKDLLSEEQIDEYKLSF